jgi:hypothetical protein
VKYLLLIFFALPCFASKEEEAMKAAAMAAYKQFVIEDNVIEIVRKKVPKQYKDLAEKLGPFLDVIVRQKVEGEWKF